MKKFYTFILMAAALVACTGIEQPELVENPDASKTYTMTVKASKTVDTKALTLTGSTLTAKWAENEEVKVYEGSTLLGSLYAQELTNNGASCSLRGTLDNAPSASGVTLTLKFNTASYGGQDGTLDYIANHCDYAEATTTVTIDGSTITGTTAAFTNKQAIVKFTLVDRADATGTLSPSVLNATVSYMGVLLRNYSFNVPGTTYTTNGAGIIFLAIPSDIPSSVQIGGNTINTDPANISFTLSATVGSETYNYSRTGFPFENGKY